jgi:hypothetical protein
LHTKNKRYNITATVAIPRQESKIDIIVATVESHVEIFAMK